MHSFRQFSQSSIPVICLMAILTAGTMRSLRQSRPAEARAEEDRNKSAFPKLFNTESLQIPRMPASEAARTMKVPDGFEVEVFASEPDVHQPIGIATDARGRLWVAENYTYAERAVNYDDRLKDRIVILEDTDGDGQSDRRTVFWDEAEKLTSVEIGFGGVWALCAPNLLFLPDRNGDDVMDGPPEVVLDGWNDSTVRHNIVNGLRWGPDGWLYGRHGIMATSFVAPPGTAAEQRTPINCGVWRYHPTRRDFEVVARGTTNPWGMDWNEDGELFIINTVIGHLWHVFPGARFRRMYGEHFNPHLYEVMEQAADHFHWDTAEAWHDLKKLGMSRTTDAAGGGHAHSGMLIYQGSSWPSQYRGDVFALNLHGRRMNRDHLKRSGSGYSAHHAEDFLKAADPWFRAIEMIQGPAGEVYIADWSDIGECHENDGVHRTSGRIYRVGWKTATPVAHVDFNRVSDDDLIDYLLAEDSWHSRQALQQLHQRTAAGTVSEQTIRRMQDEIELESTAHRQLRAIWGLAACRSILPKQLIKWLDHPEESVRTWSIRLMLEQDQLNPDQVRELIERAKTERSGLVRLYLAAALAETPLPDRVRLATALLQRVPEDQQLELLIWYGIEPAVESETKSILELASVCPGNRLPRFISRRITYSSNDETGAMDGLLDTVTKAADKRKVAMLQGMTEAMRGWQQAAPPTNWKRIQNRLQKSDNDQIISLTRELSIVFGDGRALSELKSLALDRSTSLETRRNAVRVLVQQRVEGLAPVLQKLLGERDLAGAAARGLAAYQHPDTADLILAHFNRMYTHDRRDAISTLTVRPESTESLLQAIEEGKVDRKSVTAFQIRQMASLGNEKIRSRLITLWPELRLTTDDQQRRIKELKADLTNEVLAAADRSHGRLLFSKTCGGCHVLFGKGKPIGPDLTGSQRTNLSYLLENIVAPSLQVAEAYRMTTFQLEDGRVISGVATQKNSKTITVQTPTENLVLRLDEIEESRNTGLSMMPERQLDVMKSEEVRDLIAYLMSAEQVPLPRTGE